MRRSHSSHTYASVAGGSIGPFFSFFVLIRQAALRAAAAAAAAKGELDSPALFSFSFLFFFVLIWQAALRAAAAAAAAKGVLDSERASLYTISVTEDEVQKKKWAAAFA